MDYVLMGVILLVILAVFGAVMARMGTSLGGRGNNQTAPFAGPDETPAGDTTEHAGDTSPEGHTDPADAQRGGTGSPQDREPAQPNRRPAGRFKRDPVGGEGEGETTVSDREARPS